MLLSQSKYTGRSVRCKRARHLCRFRGRCPCALEPNNGFERKNGLRAEPAGSGSRAAAAGPSPAPRPDKRVAAGAFRPMVSADDKSA